MIHGFGKSAANLAHPHDSYGTPRTGGVAVADSAPDNERVSRQPALQAQFGSIHCSLRTSGAGDYELIATRAMRWG
jgi:hypothetical protein